MNKLDESLNKLKIKLKEKEDLTKEEWNEYARENSYYSSVTIEAHMNLKNWTDVKKKIFDGNLVKNLNIEIKKTRKKLDKSIEKTGLWSNETIELSNQMNVLINKYYKENKSNKKGRQYKEGNTMDALYLKSYEHLKKVTTDIGEFPSIEIWNAYAKRNNCLNSQSIEYISGMNWHKLRDKINTIFKNYKNN